MANYSSYSPASQGLPAAVRLKNLLRPVYHEVTRRIGYRFLAPVTIEGFFGDIPVNLRRLPYFRREFFPDAGPKHWLDEPNALAVIDERLRAKQLTEEHAKMCRDWVNNGFVVLPHFIEHSRLDRIWESYEGALRDGRVVPEPVGEGDPHWGRRLNPHREVPEIAELLRDSAIQRQLQILMGREVLPFQTITAHAGSQQKTHSDAIHMTTYPLGYMTAAWIAFEDIHPASGPLVYYPGSHRLPYFLSKEVGIRPEEFRDLSYRVYTEKYEPFVERLIESRKLVPQTFLAKKGDVFLWHHNLLHGGSHRKDLKFSRKSVVCHYFVKGAVCYHDLASSLATL